MKVIYMYIGRRGTDEHARTKWAGQFETRGYRVRSLCAGCVNHRKFNGPPSLRVPPGSFDAKYHVYVYYYTANRRLCMGVPPYRSIRYQNCVGALPPQIKYCGGACPPCPPPVPPPMMYNTSPKKISKNYKMVFTVWFICHFGGLAIQFRACFICCISYHIVSTDTKNENFPKVVMTQFS